MKKIKIVNITLAVVILGLLFLIASPIRIFYDNFTTNYDKVLLLGGTSIGVNAVNFNNTNDNNMQTKGEFAAGTLTYIDPNTNSFGAFGHKNTSSNTSNGYVYNTNVITTIKSDSNVGYKIVEAKYDEVIGEYNKNGSVGVFGNIYQKDDYQKIKVANPREIKLEKAYIKTILDGNEVETFEIKITFINYFSADTNIFFTVVDEELLNKTGGIVQGMSGSPIVQNDKIIGAISSVNVKDYKDGFGVFITNMLKEQTSKSTI